VANPNDDLAGAADRDVSEFKQILQGHTRTLNALRETQLEQGDRLTNVEGRLTNVEGRLTNVEREMHDGFSEMREGFSTLHVGMAQITALLRNIETQGDQPDQS
jgi:hypothetical protein